MPRCQRHQPCFVDRMGQWLLTVNMLARTIAAQRRYRVSMVWRTDSNSVNTFLVIEHDAKVGIDFGRRILLECCARVVCIDITQRDERSTCFRQIADFSGSLAANPDARQVDGARLLPSPGRNDGEDATPSGSLEQLAARYRFHDLASA